MKTTLCPRFLTMLALLSLALPALPQGSLTPPGAPAPTMKRLDEVEARTIVNATNTPPSVGAAFVISQPGSYYLTGNIAVTSGDGIDITASNVSLDLNGFRISSTVAGGSGSGIFAGNTLSGITIRHGSITGTTTFTAPTTFTPGGFQSGIYTGASNVQIDGLRVTGIGGDGISVFGGSTLVTHCTVSVSGFRGIYAYYAKVVDCAVEVCKADGIYATSVDQCIGATKDDTSTYFGINVAESAHSCVGRADNGGYSGLYASNAADCTGVNAGGPYGLRCTRSALNCTGVTSGATPNSAGLYCINATDCYGLNSGTAASSFGIYCTNATNCYGTNSCTGGTTYGIRSVNATNCYGTNSGTSANSYGLSCTDGTNCYGFNSCSANGTLGLSGGNLTNCFGSTDSGTGTGTTGLSCFNATNCRGVSVSTAASNTGLNCTNGMNCLGSTSGTAANNFGIVSSIGTLSNCRGLGGGGTAVAIQATIGIGCTFTGGTAVLTNRYNMP